MRPKKKLPGIITVLVVAALMLSFTSKKKLSVDGVWSIAEVQTVRPDGTFTTVIPNAGLAIFSRQHYSISWTSHVSAASSWQIPDSVKLARFNQSIINTGSFELKDSILTTKAAFAMNPMFVNGLAKFKCNFIGDTLVLRGLSVFSPDNIAHPVYANGSHIVTKLLKVKNR
jgi:hypothetical protein